jgi:hypothetical protein
MSELQKECESILKTLIKKHECLCPENKVFGVFDAGDAMNIVADLVEKIQYSDDISFAMKLSDWGK